ncbi:MAG TPA: hypothetical protein VI072_21770 [Polyangiaceae bacterium]
MTPSSVSDSELLARIPELLTPERSAIADVIEHLAEVDRRRLYLEQACSSLHEFCIERLGYSEDEALERVRVAHLAQRLPRVLAELRDGTVQITDLSLLAPHLTEENAEALLSAARGKSHEDLERLLAESLPRADAEPTGAGSKIEPLSPDKYLVEFTASEELHAKLEKAQELLRHVLPAEDLPRLMERALAALIEQETKRKSGATVKPKRR